MNPSFEDGQGGQSVSWQYEARGAKIERSFAVARSGASSLELNNLEDVPRLPYFRQRIVLEPYTPYVLRGWIRGEQASDLGAPRFFAEIGAEPYFLASTGPAKAQDLSSDWQTFELQFETGYDGNVDVTGRLNGKGRIYFDDLSIVCNQAVERFESPHFILDLRPDQVAATGVSAIEGVVHRTEQVILSLAELTSQSAAPSGYRQAAWGPDWFEDLGWPAEEPGGAGYPFLWAATQRMLTEGWRRSDYVPESFLRAIAQNFMLPAFDFELRGIPEAHDTTGLLVYHVYDTLELASVEPLVRLGSTNRERYAKAHDTYWEQRRCARSDALAYRDMRIADEVGWAPISAAYRALASADPRLSPWQRVDTFHRTIAEQSGRALAGSDDEVAKGLALLSHREWDDVHRYFARSFDVEYPTPAAVEANVAQLPLALATWESATTDWASPMRNTLADGCPLATETRAYASGLWAHASSRYVFDLGAKWQRLDADFGLPLGIIGGSVRFDVIGDGKLLFSSMRIADGASHQLSVSVASMQRLELVTESPPSMDGNIDRTADWGLWLEPMLIR